MNHYAGYAFHADYLSVAQRMKLLSGSRIAYPAIDSLSCVEIGVEQDRPFRVGHIGIHPLLTP